MQESITPNPEDPAIAEIRHSEKYLDFIRFLSFGDPFFEQRFSYYSLESLAKNPWKIIRQEFEIYFLTNPKVQEELYSPRLQGLVTLDDVKAWITALVYMPYDFYHPSFLPTLIPSFGEGVGETGIKPHNVLAWMGLFPYEDKLGGYVLPESLRHLALLNYLGDPESKDLWELELFSGRMVKYYTDLSSRAEERLQTPDEMNNPDDDNPAAEGETHILASVLKILFDDEKDWDEWGRKENIYKYNLGKARSQTAQAYPEKARALAKEVEAHAHQLSLLIEEAKLGKK